jgi:lipopolysaccharide/colanic/teichoic acid biosynthesis glycosyltransferase
VLRIDRGPGRVVKRLLDVAASGLGLLVAGPLLLVVAVAVKVDSPGPVFHRQERVGRRGERFLMWKFRTMIPDAEAQGPRLTAAGDRRVTRLGGLLRRTKVDELPQLLNVLGGSMSLVGPRPEVPEYVARYRPEERRVLEVRPGITDPASIAYRNEEEILARAPDPVRHYEEVVMRDKLRINLAYLERATVLSDVGVLVRTLAVVLPGRRG